MPVANSANDVKKLHDDHGTKNILIVFFCLFSGLLISYLTGSPYGSYVPIILIAIIEWYRSYPREIRSYYGLCRLLLYIMFISLWVIFILRLIVQSVAFVFGYRHIPIGKVQHLFPYALMFTSFARAQHDMDLHDKRRYIIHLLYDVPAFLLVVTFKLLNNPLNSLCSQITPNCYLGCLPTSADVEELNRLGITRVINMCAEYRGPRKTYERYGIEQLYLPTVDCTTPSRKSIEKAVEFMKAAGAKNEKVFVHCKAGMGRSATVVYCHLIANDGMSPENALKLMKEKRPEISSSIVGWTPVKQFLASLDKNKT